MRILVTGGAGFIGSHLVKALATQGIQVTVIDDLSTGNQRFISDIVKNNRVNFVHGSVLDRSLLEKSIRENDMIFHLAAVLGVKNTVENPLRVIEGNIDGTRNVLELAFKYKVKVIFTSTSEIYGKNDQLPFSEEADRVLGPATKQRWCYATAKALDEHMCFAYAQKGLPITVIRYFNVYGPRAVASQYGGVIPKFIAAALKNEPITIFGTGEQTRCFTYIDDAIKGTISCMAPKCDNQALNIGTNQEISINQLANAIITITGSTSTIIHVPYQEAYGEGYEDTPNRVPELEKAKSLLNYQPSIDIFEGLKRTVDWYRNCS